MSDHDPFCVYADADWRSMNPPYPREECERCAALAKARADERERIAAGAAIAIDWSPIGNTIAAAAVMAERERIAQAVRAFFADTAPPYLFPSGIGMALPGTRSITTHEALKDVWRVACEETLDLIARGDSNE